MRPSVHRSALTTFTLLALLSCTEAPTAPTSSDKVGGPMAAGGSGASLIISQVYGGGGNSGATFRNDFIELHNAGADTVRMTNWSVQYASSAGTTWQVTPISGVVPPGGFFLIQESQGSGGTVSLPTPDGSGTIAMSATAGKVALVSSTTALTGTCPAAGAAVDE